MPRTAVPLRIIAALLLILAALTAGCGDSGGDFAGRVIVPAGFTEIQGPGGSFVHPSGWAFNRRKGDEDILTVMPSVGAGDGNSSVTLTHTAPLDGNFDGALALRRDLAEKAATDRTKATREDVDVAGAQRAVRFRAQATLGGTRYALDDLAVLLEDGSALFLSVAVPSGNDADTIVKSFRVTGG